MSRRCKSGSIPGFGGQRANAIAEGIIGAMIVEPLVKSHWAAFDGNSRKYLILCVLVSLPWIGSNSLYTQSKERIGNSQCH
jgi:hypothetical protein